MRKQITSKKSLMLGEVMSAILLQALRDAIGTDSVRDGQPERIAYAADMWPRTQIWRRSSEVNRYPPTAVVFPEDEAAVQKVVQIAGAHKVPVIPYGGGSGVCGGTIPIHGGVVIDSKRMRRVVAINDVDLTVEAQTGILGPHLEGQLNDRGYTLGHFPSSIMCSTLGGWLAARSAGQYSTKYGKIEDMVIGLRAVLADGEILQTGPGLPFDWTQVLVGSEGTLGLVTSATLRIHPLPETQLFRAYRFRSVEAGSHAIRRVMQANLRPNLVRLYDPLDSLIHSRSKGSGSGALGTALEPLRELFGGPISVLRRRGPELALAMALSVPQTLNRLIKALPVSSLLIMGFQGNEETTHDDMDRARVLLESAGGIDGGDGPGWEWHKGRYNVSFKQSALFNAGAFADTMEVSCTWSRLMRTYQEVREAVAPHALLMAHFSHAYPDGCSIYFTFAGYRRDAAALERLYDRVWSEALSATVRAGASISHHHGIGLAKRDLMGREHGAGLQLLYALKDGLDPLDRMNPGKLLPDRAVRK